MKLHCVQSSDPLLLGPPGTLSPEILPSPTTQISLPGDPRKNWDNVPPRYFSNLWTSNSAIYA